MAILIQEIVITAVVQETNTAPVPRPAPGTEPPDDRLRAEAVAEALRILRDQRER